ncbi:MAG: response regulator [Deltaproteobacteria bacterium]|nr:response regulator [Deltaproteobacteria bacterium]
MATILVIDDDKIIRELITLILESADHTVITAQDGTSAFKCYADRKVDIVITDILMPDMDGIEVISGLKKKDPNVKFIAISGGGSINSNNYLKTAKLLGVKYVFQKPFDADDILQAVNALLQEDV